jgi:hypothetical protein
MTALEPPRIILAHGVGRRCERMAAIELKRFALTLPFVSSPESREGLDGRRGKRAQKLGHVRAAAYAPHVVMQALAEALDEVRTDELRIGRLDAIASPGVRHGDRADVDRVNHEIAIDRHPNPHVVHGLARRPHPSKELVIVILRVDEMGIDVEQAVVTLKAFVADAALMQALAWSGTGRERHGRVGGCGNGGLGDEREETHGRLRAHVVATIVPAAAHFTLWR